MELSTAVKQICKENYETNCDKCPLRPSCVTRETIRTQQDLDNHREVLNAHAAQIISRGGLVDA